MLSSIWNKLKEIIKKMTGPKTVEQVLHVSPTVSSAMADAIELWTNMYEGNAPWLHEYPNSANPIRITSLGLPALIASEKARMATLEMESEINAPTAEVEKENPEYEPPSMNADGSFNMGRGRALIKEDVPTGPTERAEYLNEEYKKLKKQIRRQLEYGVAKGGLVIKPYIVIHDGFKESSPDSSNTDDSTNNQSENKNTPESKLDNIEKDLKSKDNSIKSVSSSKPKGAPAGKVTNIDNNVENKRRNRYNADIEFDFIQADGFFPIAFDSNGHITEAAFIQRKADKDVTFSRVEYHKLEKQTVTIINKAYKAFTGAQTKAMNADLGDEIPLTAVPEWSSLQPQTTIAGVDRLLFGYFKMPDANTIDTYSPLGVSGYSRVVNLIKDADYQYSRILWEYEAGEMAIDIDRDALKIVQDENGRDITIRPIMQDRLFRKIDLNTEDTYKPFAPELRDTSLVNGLNTILMRIEDATGMSRGTISDADTAEAKTATELKILKQRSYATNADLQAALEETLKDVIYVMDVYCSLYKITPEGEYEVSFTWDDSILVDIESELSKRLTLMQNGLTTKVETRMWYFGETENQAKAAIQKVDDENKANIEENMMAQAQLGEVAQKQSNDALKKDPNASPTAKEGRNAKTQLANNKDKTMSAVPKN